MALLATAAGMDRKFNWDDDDDDDFDLDTWKATVDTSSPSVDDLGPLQILPREDKIGDIVMNSFECTGSDDAYWEVPDSASDDTAVDEWPMVVSERDCTPEEEAAQAQHEAEYSDMLENLLEEQLASARYQYLTHAIGMYFDGKEHADAPAYPELSEYHGQRYRYARAFQSIKYEHGRRQAEVYRHSPLVVVTAIEDADLIDDAGHYGEYQETADGGHVEGCEHDAPEMSLPDFTVTFEQCQKDADEQVTLATLPALEHFSPDEVKELVDLWRASQDEDGDNVFYSEDSSSIDTWERSDTDEEDIPEPRGAEDDDDPDTYSDVCPLEPKASTYNEEFDFNDIVFCIDYDIESRDEGYMSSSPPVSPVLDLLADGCEPQPQCTELTARLTSVLRVDSMDALDALCIAEESARTHDSSAEETTPVEPAATTHACTQLHNNDNDKALSQPTHPATLAISLTPHRTRRASPLIATATWHHIADRRAACTPAPRPPPPVTLYTTPHPHEPLQIQIVYLTSIFFTGLLYIVRWPWASIGIVPADALVARRLGAGPSGGRVLEVK